MINYSFVLIFDKF